MSPTNNVFSKTIGTETCCGVVGTNVGLVGKANDDESGLKVPKISSNVQEPADLSNVKKRWQPVGMRTKRSKRWIEERTGKQKPIACATAAAISSRGAAAVEGILVAEICGNGGGGPSCEDEHRAGNASADKLLLVYSSSSKTRTPHQCKKGRTDEITSKI